MNGVTRIRNAFISDRRAALMPYFTIGYPDLPTSIDIIEACCNAGAGLMELGVPFSDPLADGPTIQHSTQVALQNGTTSAKCLEAVQELRARGIETPFLLMGYVNPILRYGKARYINDAARSGADGFIIPDYPPDEAQAFALDCQAAGMALIHLLAPNSTEERVGLVIRNTQAFIYLVSVTGITGARTTIAPELESFVQKVRRQSGQDIPLAVGFGIGTTEQATAVAEIADGVIVGSALINVVKSAVKSKTNPVDAAARFVEDLVSASA